MPKMIETWDEAPLVLQLMAGFDALYGYVGMDDYTLYPFVRPGAFVRIDPRQNKIPSVGWHGDYDRPIFFRGAPRALRLYLVRDAGWSADSCSKPAVEAQDSTRALSG